MKSHALLAALCVGAVLTQAQTEIVTLYAVRDAATATVLDVKAGQTAELLSWPSSGGSDPEPAGVIKIIRAGQPVFEFGLSKHDLTLPFRIAGPVQLELRPHSAVATFATFRLSPASEISPPGNTVVIPSDTPGAEVIMESSTDLANWSPALPGVFTNASPSHLFFRLRAERLPN